MVGGVFWAGALSESRDAAGRAPRGINLGARLSGGESEVETREVAEWRGLNFSVCAGRLTDPSPKQTG